jgi:hypothetical protein
MSTSAAIVICSWEDGHGSGRPVHAGRPELTVARTAAGRITPIGATCAREVAPGSNDNVPAVAQSGWPAMVAAAVALGALSFGGCAGGDRAV